jgi:SRSO17 transposase
MEAGGRTETSPARKGNTGRPPKLLRRAAQHPPVSVKELALSLPSESWKKVNWRQGVKQKLQSRFAALRVRPAHRDYERAAPHAEEWLLIEWRTPESEPTKYWLATLPADMTLVGLVHLAKHRRIIERDYEGRGWRGFHHHLASATKTCILRTCLQPGISGTGGSSLMQVLLLPKRIYASEKEGID